MLFGSPGRCGEVWGNLDVAIAMGRFRLAILGHAT